MIEYKVVSSCVLVFESYYLCPVSCVFCLVSCVKKSIVIVGNVFCQENNNEDLSGCHLNMKY